MADDTDDKEVQDDLFNKEMEDAGKPDVEENEDGSATVSLDDTTLRDDNPDFYANLADGILTDNVLSSLGPELVRIVEQDLRDREERDKKYAEGLRRTGLGDEAPGGAKFKGASRVVHPMLTEAAVDFSHRAMQELMPRGSGPVKDNIIGEVTKEKVSKAKRLTNFFNWQLTNQIPEFRPELEQGMTQVPMGGAHYIKPYWSDRYGRPKFAHIDADDLILPYAADSFLGAERMTHRQRLTQLTMEDRIESGLYRKVPTLTSTQPEMSDARQATDKIQGATDSINQDGVRDVFEVYTFWNLEEEYGMSPYIITVEQATHTVLAVYRNWDLDDPLRVPLQHIVEFPFVPWRGAYPLGLPHLIGGLSAAATGSLRALLDSAHISNTQAALKLKGGTKGGQNLNVQPTEIKEIEGAAVSTDPDIRKVVMPLPFPPPSNVLLQLLGMLTEAGRQVIRTTFEDLPDQTTQMPVGTTLALIEQGMVVYSGIHARLHDAMGRMLRVLYRLNRDNLRDSVVYNEVGEVLATREDFEGPLNVAPVSDPNIFSQVQRSSQIALIAQRQQTVPGLYDPRAVEERILQDAKIPDAKALLVPKPEPKNLSALNENLAASRGIPIAPFPDQDHLAHIQIHMDFLKSPFLGMNPIIAPKFLPIMIQHIMEHITFFYARTMYDKLSASLGMEASELMGKNDSEMDAQFEQLIAMSSQLVVPQVEQTFTGAMPILQQAMQMMQSLMPPPMMDPSQAALQKAQMDNQTKQQELQLRGQESQMRTQEKQGDLQAKTQIAAAQQQTTKEVAAVREQNQNARTQLEVQSRRDMNREDNMTALVITEKELEHDAKTQLSTGTGINPGPDK